jgi:hypothetical protein
MLRDGLLIMGVQQMEELFSLQTYEISFITTHDGYVGKRLSMRNKKRGRSLGILYLLFSSKITQIPK